MTVTQLRRAARNRERAETAFRTAVRAAHAEGMPLRAIGAAVGLTHVRVLQIVRGD